MVLNPTKLFYKTFKKVMTFYSKKRIFLYESEWLTEGDKNMSFFHHIASHKRRKTVVTCFTLMDDTSSWDHLTIHNAAIDYFQE